MHFDDLDACKYHPGRLDAAEWGVPLRAVGWLDHPHPFEVGSVPPGLASRIGQLVEQTALQFPHYRFRGVHECSICQAAGRVSGGWSHSQDNLIVPGHDEVYAAPGGIVHYISDHSYLPPAAFLEAVAACPDSGSEEYFEALRRANGGRPPPMRSSEEYRREVRSNLDKTSAFRRALGVPIMQATRTQVLAVAPTIWPEASLSDEAESIYLGALRVSFDKDGRVVDVS